MEPSPAVFGPENVINGVARPTSGPNAWVAAFDDPRPTLTLSWPGPVKIGRVELSFDTDFDHPMESVLMGHPEADMPFCVRHFRLRDAAGAVLGECTDNHCTRRTVRLPEPVETDRLTIEAITSHGAVPAAIFEVRVYRE